MHSDHDRIKESIASFIIEGPGSEPELEEHLASCAECRSEVIEMRETIGLISSLGVAINSSGSLPGSDIANYSGDSWDHGSASSAVSSLYRIDASKDSRGVLDSDAEPVDLVTENRRLRRRVMVSKVVAVAASIVALASLVGLATTRHGASANYVATVSASPASATINMVSPNSSKSPMGTLIAEPRGWGSQLVLTMKGLAPGKTYQIVVVSGSTSEVAGNYAVPRSGTLHVIAASSIWANKISGVDIVANDGKTYSRSAS
ncbi:MAG: hypothetical protein M0019_07615 [Actinomycetota bacterium]|nr:hypothetical protein [Actinomycetota bacterium]